MSAAKEPADHRADDADEHGDDDAAGIAPGHHELGDHADNQAEENPSEHNHSAPPACRVVQYLGRWTPIPDQTWCPA